MRVTNSKATDNSKWGKTGCGIMFLLALAIPFYYLGGPLIFAGLFVLGGFGYFLWLYQGNRANSDPPDDPDSGGQAS